MVERKLNRTKTCIIALAIATVVFIVLRAPKIKFKKKPDIMVPIVAPPMVGRVSGRVDLVYILMKP